MKGKANSIGQLDEAQNQDDIRAHYALGTAHHKLGQTDAAVKEIMTTAEAIQARQRSNYSRELGAERPNHQ
jgi:hypothetical protein